MTKGGRTQSCLIDVPLALFSQVKYETDRWRAFATQVMVLVYAWQRSPIGPDGVDNRRHSVALPIRIETNGEALQAAFLQTATSE